MAKNLQAGLRQSIKASRKAGVTGAGIFSLAPLDLRFALQKTLDPRVTFTRASTGTFVGSDGVLHTATTNEARFDHNPTTGESLGLLMEEARTNLLLNSATLSTQSVTVAAAANTLSFYGTGTVTLTGVSTAGPLVGTGANNRVSLTFTPTVGVLILTVSGSVTNAQLEAGAFATSYIPTTTATVTRALDVASITGTAFSSFYNQTEGTVFGQFLRTASTNSQQGRVFSFNDGTNTNALEIYQTGASNPSAQITATTAQALWTPSGFTVGTSIKEVLGYQLNNSNASFNGSAETLDTVCNIPTVTQARIGDRQDGVRNLNGTIKRLTYWPVRLPNPTLVSITQP
jgi:hypothetical protein